MKFRNEATFDVVGLGVSTLDMFTVVEAFPTGREVHRAVRMTTDGGGPVATALTTLAILGGRAAMLDRVGGDAAGQSILRDFARYGVQTDAVQIAPDTLSAAAAILVEASSGNRAIYYQPSSAPEIADAAKFRAVIESGRVLHINGRHFAALPGATAIAKQAGVKISFDGGANRYQESMRALAQASDICIVAKDFAEKYTGETDPARAATRLLQEGPQIVGVTCGAGGSYIASKDAPLFHQNAYAMESVVDTTGCGDSYHGAFLYALTRGATLKSAASLASAVAAINTQTLGGRSGLPDLAQAKDFLRARGDRIETL